MRTLLPLAFLLLVFSCTVKNKPAYTHQKKTPDPDSLIGLFTGIQYEDFGFDPNIPGCNAFLPFTTDFRPGIVIDTDKVSGNLVCESFPTFGPLMQVITCGPSAIPFLLRHLSDSSKTKYTIRHRYDRGGMVYLDAYDYNKNTLHDSTFLDAVNTAGTFDAYLFHSRQTANLPDTIRPGDYTLTVGDICFVALGQIVNRGFCAARYQGTYIYCIMSPVLKPQLRNACKTEWANTNPAKHKTSLLMDFKYPDLFGRDMGAYQRLSFYYPEEIIKLRMNGWGHKIDSLEAFIHQNSLDIPPFQE